MFNLIIQSAAIKEVHEGTNISIESLCRLSKVSRAAYYGWLNHIKSGRELLREKVAQEVVKIHQEYPDMGYRRMNDWIKKYSESHLMVSDSLVLRVRRILNIKSVIKYKTDGCTRNAKDPKYIFENLLNRDFDAGVSNARWMTDVTEFKYTTADGVLHKLYLSAIIDGHDRRIVSYVIGDRNNTALAFETMEKALKENPGAHPMIHTDRGFQYTSNGFHKIVEKAGLVHSMSRVGCCADNGLMEGFWGMLKRERYYTRKFTSRKAVVSMINGYIYFYNNKRIQRKLHLLAPMEVFNAAPMAA